MLRGESRRCSHAWLSRVHVPSARCRPGQHALLPDTASGPRAGHPTLAELGAAWGPVSCPLVLQTQELRLQRESWRRARSRLGWRVAEPTPGRGLDGKAHLAGARPCAPPTGTPSRARRALRGHGTAAPRGAGASPGHFSGFRGERLCIRCRAGQKSGGALTAPTPVSKMLRWQIQGLNEPEGGRDAKGGEGVREAQEGVRGPDGSGWH